MEDFTEEHSKILLPKEWLVKIDATTSTPYLFKFAHSADWSECYILISDTKKVWTEVLPKKRIARRWKQCNPNLPMPDEVNLSSKILCAIHSASGLFDASFDIIDTPDADLSFEMEFEGFKWRWDTYLLGPRTSSDIISKQLIMPLITMVHVAFYSADPVSELPEKDLEKVVDNKGRAARRSIDTHVKHTLSKPRIATSLQRVSALLGLVPDLPSINSELQPNDLESLLAQCNSKPTPDESDQAAAHSRPTATESQPRPGRSGESSHSKVAGGPSAGPPPVAPVSVNSGSETDMASDDDAPADGISSVASAQTGHDHHRGSPAQASRHTSVQSSRETLSASGDGPSAAHPVSRNAEPSAGSNSRSPPPSKKPKLNATGRSGRNSDSDSDDGRAGKGSQASQSTAGAGRGRGSARGVRQPLKRGVKRF